LTDGTIAGYFGPKGRGKTTLALRDLVGARRLLVHDLKSDDAMTDGMERIACPHELVDRLIAAGDAKPFRVAWRGFTDMGDQEAFEHANRAAWLLGNLAVLWDDADTLLDSQPLRHHARKIAKMGRGRAIDLFYTAQRPALVPRDLTNNADRIVTFRMQDDRDIARLAWRLEVPGTRIRDLPDFAYIDWRDGQPALVKKPRRRKKS
jgi:hypothetical protein